MMQGQLIKRTHVPKPAVDADGWGTVNAADAPNGSSVLLKSDEPPVMEMYAPEDFVVGGEVNLFGTVFYIYDCDDFTKDYNKHVLGRNVTQEQVADAKNEAPSDLYIEHVAAQRNAKMEDARRQSFFAASGALAARPALGSTSLKWSGTALEVLAALTLGFQRLRCRALRVY